jgi:hypothetical protein
MTTNKILLYVAASHATAALWRVPFFFPSARAGKLAQCRTLGNDESGWAAFNEMLMSHPGTPVYVVVDSVEEDYRYEALPHAGPRARREMVARKLKQAFRNNPFCAALAQGREPGKRRDDRFLFAALTNPDLLRPWLEIIATRQSPLGGAYLSSTVSRALLPALQSNAKHLLLVSEQSGGLRQSYFQDEQLRISRLTPLDSIHPPAHVTAYAAEIGKTRFYLNSQRQMSREERLTVYLLYQSKALAELREWLNSDPGFLCHSIGLEELGARLGIAPAVLKQSPDALLLSVLALQPPPANLAPAGMQRGFRHHQARLALYGLSIAALLAALGWTGANSVRQSRTVEQTAQTEANIKRQGSLYLEVARQFPNAPTSADNLKGAVEIAQAVQRNARTPEAAMAAVSRALEASPGVVLQRLRWNRGAAQAASAAAEAPPAPAQLAGTQAPPQLIYLDAEIQPFRGDYRAAMAAIDAFVAKLKQDGAVAQASVLQLPLDTSPGSGLSGSTSGGSQPAAAHFRVKIVLREES